MTNIRIINGELLFVAPFEDITQDRAGIESHLLHGEKIEENRHLQDFSVKEVVVIIPGLLKMVAVPLLDVVEFSHETHGLAQRILDKDTAVKAHLDHIIKFGSSPLFKLRVKRQVPQGQTAPDTVIQRHTHAHDHETRHQKHDHFFHSKPPYL